MRRALLLALVLAALAPAAASQNCCLSVDADDPGARDTVEGVMIATALMIVVPFSIVGAFAVYFVRRERVARRCRFDTVSSSAGS